MIELRDILLFAESLLKKHNNSYREMVVAILSELPDLSMKKIPLSLTARKEILAFVFYDEEHKKFRYTSVFGVETETVNILASDYYALFREMDYIPIIIFHTHPTPHPLSKYLSLNDIYIAVTLKFPYVALFYLEQDILDAECRVYDFRKALEDVKHSQELIMSAYMNFKSENDPQKKLEILAKAMKTLGIRIFQINIGA